MNPLPHKTRTMKALNNTVIKNLSPEMGKRIIAKYKADGWDVSDVKGALCERDGDRRIYYGVIGTFGSYSLNQVQSANARIIDLDEFIPKRGDMVMVWDGDENDAREQIYLTTIEGCVCPIVSVYPDDADKFIKGEVFSITVTRHMKPVTKPDPKAEAKKRIDEAVANHMAEVAKLQEEMNRLINEI